MLKRSLILFSFLTLTGCVTQTMWLKEGATPEEDQLALKQCMLEAEKHSNAAMLSSSAARERKIKLRDLCLESKGYKRVSQETRKAGSVNEFLDAFK